VSVEEQDQFRAEKKSPRSVLTVLAEEAEPSSSPCFSSPLLHKGGVVARFPNSLPYL
jgi:hypothetical protein